MVEYIKNTNITSLKNIAYTLMDGREWMESRLAIIAKDEKDLLEKLESYLEGSKGDLEVFYGHVEEEQLYSQDTAKEEFNGLVLNNNLKTLAQIWVSGIQFNYKKLPQFLDCRHVSLPTYPFARQSYWVTDTAVNQELEVVDKNPQKVDGDVEQVAEQVLIEAISGILKVPMNSMNVNEKLSKYGFDSLSGMRFINWFQEQHGAKFL